MHNLGLDMICKFRAQFIYLKKLFIKSNLSSTIQKYQISSLLTAN